MTDKAKPSTKQEPTQVAQAQPQTTTQPDPSATNALAIVSLVLGIVAVLSGWAPFWGLIVGIAAIVLGVIGLKKPGSKGLSIAGIITGAVGTLWSIITTILFIIAIGIFGAGLSIAGEAANDYMDKQQQVIDAKRDFKKGETAVFEDKFEVKVNSVTRNYEPTDGFLTTQDGFEFILVNISVKNISSVYEYFSDSSIKVDADGIANGTTYNTSDGAFPSGNIASGKTVTGTIIYEVPKDETNLKLVYETYAYDFKENKAKNIVYSLDF